MDRLTCQINLINIWSPFVQNDSSYTQDYIAGGLLALAGNSKLTYADRAAVAEDLVTAFGNGMNGTIQNALTTDDGFNDSLTLWGLTVYSDGNTPLQEYINELTTTSTTSGHMSSSSAISSSIDSSSTIAEVRDVVRGRIQSALAASKSSPIRSQGDTAALLGVPKSNLSKALKLAPAGVKSPNGKINISKFSKFISKNSKAAALLSGKSKGKR